MAQPRAIEQAGHQPCAAAQLGEQRLDLLHRQHRRQAHRTLGARHPVEPAQVTPEHLLVQEQQCGQCLPLRRRSHLALRRQVRKESGCLSFAEIVRMALAMKINVTLDPMNICLLRTPAVVQPPDRGANLVQQFWRSSTG